MSYIDELNEAQVQAVLQMEGPLLILAGAGSGKTRVLTYRIAYMVNECGISSSNILAITFTKKAASEMKERVNKLLGGMSSNMWVGTFHACCARILRIDIEPLGYGKSFIIYDEADALSVIKDAMKTLNMSEKDLTPKSVKEVISRAKNQMQSEKDFAKKYANDYRMDKISRIYNIYQSTLRKMNALDFDDIIFQTVKLFEENEDILLKYRNKFQYIMVDEYQDTNVMQYKLVSLLAAEHQNLCVVGDDDQSIYSFRGADITNILNFEKEFPQATVIRLEQNYRSTANILNSANTVIKNNKTRKGKTLWTNCENGEKVVRYEADNEHAEASYVVSEINKLVMSNNYKYSDIAVLYRINTLSRIIEEALMKASMPYKIIGGHKFYDRKEIRDIISYLKFLENPDDSYSLKRIINVPKRGIGDTTFDNVIALSMKHNLTAFDIIKNAESYPELVRAGSKLAGFGRMIGDLIDLKNTDEKGLNELIEEIYNKTGMIRSLQEDNTDESNGRIANLEEFVSVAVEFSKDYEPEWDEELGEGNVSVLEAFLESIVLVSELDNEDGTEDYVLLMSMHNSKGLEFPVVFLIGFEEGIFPGTRSMDTESDLEEERRICYVAITRAERKLYITNAAQRMLFGRTEITRQSRFIKELPPENIEDVNFAFRRTSQRNSIGVLRGSAGQSSGGATLPGFGKRIESTKDINSSFLASLGKGKKPLESVQGADMQEFNFIVGDRVRHKKFGYGILVNIIGVGGEMKVEVVFEESGLKRFMAKFANLSRAEE